jgi:hypothetical protein
MTTGQDRPVVERDRLRRVVERPVLESLGQVEPDRVVAMVVDLAQLPKVRLVVRRQGREALERATERQRPAGRGRSLEESSTVDRGHASLLASCPGR